MDDTAQAVLGRVGSVSHGVPQGGLHGAGLQYHLGIEFGLIPEMIIDGGDIDAGSFGDRADSSTFKAFFREDLAGGIEDFLAGAFLASINRDLVTFFRYHAANFKQMF